LQVGRRLDAGSFFPAAAVAGTRSARHAASTRKPLNARMKTPFSSGDRDAASPNTDA
jgi:hypothetical protein